MADQYPITPAPQQASAIYNFEGEGRRQFPDANSENDALKVFKTRLRIPDDVELADDHRDLLLNFILNFHKVISRYQLLRDKETKMRRWFTGLSLALLFATPLLIFKLTGNEANIASQVTAVLTGLIAVQKSISTWLDKRKIVGNFWKAESELKTKLYTFEDKWKGLAFETVTVGGANKKTLKDSFLIEVRAAIADSRAIVQEEQSKFFEAEINPSIDLGDLLKTAGTSAVDIVTAHSAPPRQDIEAAQRKVAQLKAEIEQWKTLIAQKHKQLADDPTMAKETADAIKNAITVQETKKLTAEGDLVNAEGQLAAL
jgi:hypothetical protein